MDIAEDIILSVKCFLLRWKYKGIFQVDCDRQSVIHIILLEDYSTYESKAHVEWVFSSWSKYVILVACTIAELASFMSICTEKKCLASTVFV